MLVEHADPQVDPVLQDGALDLVGRQRVEVNVDLPGLAPEVPEHVSHWITTFGGPVVDYGDRQSSPTSSPRSAPTVVRKLSSAVARCWHAS